MARFRRTTAKKNTYLQLVESYRNSQKQPATRVLANLGNISSLSETQIERLTNSFIKAVGVEDKFQMNNITAGKGYHYGTCLPVIAIWDQLHLEKIIHRSLPPQIKIPVSKISLIQTANRFSDPGSKLACYRWYEHSMFSQLKNFVHFPDKENKKLHMYYRSLDYLCSIKTDIEKELYFQFNGKKHQENSLILYDLTSVYFEGEQAAMAVPGYSRDQRRGSDQIVIGLVMNEAGIPLAHHVFEGNTLDKQTVDEVINDLEQRFSLQHVIFVGDRGLLTNTNIEAVKSHGYNYIMGTQKRNRRVTRYLLEKVSLTEQELQSDKLVIKEIGYVDLSESLQSEYDRSIRFIICYNRLIAKQQKRRREINLHKFSVLLNETKQEGTLKQIKESHHKLRSFLSRYKMTRFFKIDIEKLTSDSHDKKQSEQYRLKVNKNDDILSFETCLDGKFIIQTEVSIDQFTKQKIVSAYKSLQKVERAFRVSKNEIDIRPVYVRLETRIKGHVMICFLSLLIETLIEKRLYQLFPELIETKTKRELVKKSQPEEDDGLTMITLLEELDTIRLVPLYINDNEQPNYVATSIRNNVRKLFSALGIVNSSDPKYLRIQRAKRNSGGNQLELNL
jgi:transposase